MFADLPGWFLIPAALIVWMGASARLTRMATQDSFPPAAALRVWWDKITKDSEWSLLAHCHWCLAPWIVAVLGVWGYFSGLHWSWWVLCVWMTGAYVSSWLVHHDED